MSRPLRIFLAGIIQGSLPDAIHDQEYRNAITAIVRKHFPDAMLYDPFAEHPDSLKYHDELARETFFSLMERAANTDLMIAFLPEASMGTAIEMWNAYHAGAVVLCISPLTENWVVRFLADIVLPDLEALERYLASGEVEKLLQERDLS